MSLDHDALERDLPQRVVVIGDLNAQADLLSRFLLGLKLVKKNGSWCGGRTVLVQMGDVPNRGPGGRRAMDRLIDLRSMALEAGGDVVWILGNHEVLSVLGHEAYVTAEEYLEFAQDDEIEDFLVGRTRYVHEILGPPDQPGFVEPLGGRIRAWEEENAPGKESYRKGMGPTGKYGRHIRRLPVALRFGSLLFVHGGLSPSWAQHGLDGLQRLAQKAWASRAAFYQDLDPQGIFRDPLGPLWHRAYCIAKARIVQADLADALDLVGCRQMIVGHTRTDTCDDGRSGVPLVRQRGKLIMTDVGLGDPGDPGAALVIEGGRIEVWSPAGAKSRLMDLRT